MTVSERLDFIYSMKMDNAFAYKHGSDGYNRSVEVGDAISNVPFPTGPLECSTPPVADEQRREIACNRG